VGVSENMGLRKVFGPKGEEVTAVLRRLHNLQLSMCITALVDSSRMKCELRVLRMLFSYKISLGKEA
jgi:hypothetical protein